MNFPDPNLPTFVIVDDSEDDAFLLRYRLRRGGIANPVIAIQSAAAARAYVLSSYIVHTPPQLLFVDIMMEGGYDLIGGLRDEPQCEDTRIVVFTYSNEPADLKRSIELGVDGYLLKFPDPDILAEFIHHGPWFDVSHHRAVTTHALCA